MKKILALAMAALLIFCLFACAKENEDNNEEEEETSPLGVTSVIEGENGTGTFEYDINDAGDYIITKYSPASVAIVDIELPKSTDDGRDIVGIAPEAFKAQNSIRSIKIPDTYVSIGKYAFYDCDGLTTVTMANNVTTIGEGAFQACDKLATVTMSTAVTTVETRAFANCVALTSVDLSTSVVSIEEAAFLGCSALTSVTISDKITFVEKNAFNDCTSLAYTEADNGKYLGNSSNPHLVLVSAKDLNIESCVINDATKLVAKNAFSNCLYLETVTIGAGLKLINADCFNNAPSMKYNEYENARYLGTATNPYAVVMSVVIPSVSNITLHADTVMITDSAFVNCVSLTDINYPKTATEWANVIKAENWKHDRTIAVYGQGNSKIES